MSRFKGAVQAHRDGTEVKKKPTSKLRGVVSSIADGFADGYDSKVAQIRARQLPSWMEICGVSSPEDIDYNNPHVKIQWLLCDPNNISDCSSQKHFDRFLEKLNEEQQDIFFNFKDEEGNSYVDKFCHWSWRKEVTKYMKKQQNQ